MSENALGKASSSSTDGDKSSSISPKYKDKEWLTREYVDKNRSLSEIAEPFGVSKNAVYYYVKKYELKSPDRKYWYDCKNCGVESWVYESNRNSGDGVFCSQECRVEFEKDTVECGYCGSELTRANYILEDNELHFCNLDRCYASWISENMTGENHPSWTGGYDQSYSTKYREMRRKVMDRDGGCVICGVERDDNGRRIDVHHIMPLRKFNDKDDAHTLSNMVALCRSHHRKWEGLYLRPDPR